MIKYPERIKQVIDFTGLGSWNLSPSDIDMTLEFDNKYLFLFELKLVWVKVPIGQKLLLERICNCWQKTNDECFVLYCEHNTSTDEIVSVNNTWIQSIYYKGKKYKWHWTITGFLEKISIRFNILKLKKLLWVNDKQPNKDTIIETEIK
jgi:hypothetical protein